MVEGTINVEFVDGSARRSPTLKGEASGVVITESNNSHVPFMHGLDDFLQNRRRVKGLGFENDIVSSFQIYHQAHEIACNYAFGWCQNQQIKGSAGMMQCNLS